jgi:hypothetical protein
MQPRGIYYPLRNAADPATILSAFFCDSRRDSRLKCTNGVEHLVPTHSVPTPSTRCHSMSFQTTIVPF